MVALDKLTNSVQVHKLCGYFLEFIQRCSVPGSNAVSAEFVIISVFIWHLGIRKLSD